MALPRWSYQLMSIVSGIHCTEEVAKVDMYVNSFSSFLIYDLRKE